MEAQFQPNAATKNKNQTVYKAPQDLASEDRVSSPARMPLFLQRSTSSSSRTAITSSNLTISQPGDPDEQEAEAIASQIPLSPVSIAHRHSEPRASLKSLSTSHSSNSHSSNSQFSPAARPESDVGQHLASPPQGTPLPPEVSSLMGSHLGYDFSPVRVHTDLQANEMNRTLNAQAFTHRHHVYFGTGQYQPDSQTGRQLIAHELTHVVQQSATGTQVHRKGGDSTTTATAKTAATTSAVGIENGESNTPSDQTGLAKGYTKRSTDEQYDTPDGRIVSHEQAIAESRVINSEGIFMGAYLARYEALKKYGKADLLDKLSAQAGFMKQFKTGDIVLRMMRAEDSEGLAKVTNSNYSHSGIIQVQDGRVWVLDSYPARGGKHSPESGEEDSTQLTRFEEFFSDQHGEAIVQGLVLRVQEMSDEVRNRINELINKYNVEKTAFDYQFRVDNGDNVLYCSELVWRILKEAGSSTLPANEFQYTKDQGNGLIAALRAGIEFQKSQGRDTTASQKQLNMLEGFLAQAESVTKQELYSPGSLERAEGLETLAGFTREGKIEGRFNIIVVSAAIPDDSWDTPDGYVTYSGGMFGSSGTTSVKDDTTTPTWNETLLTLDYSDLNSITLKLYDKDPISLDDLLATFTADLRPVRPEGQTFTLTNSGATLRVTVAADHLTPQAPRQTK
jgi:hypothetical protein